MNLQDTIFFGCAAYSSIHPHRAAELNHLFCTNGNGYEWDENGELVEFCGETTFKNGKRRKLASAITNVFKRRKRDADYRKKWEAKRKRDEKKHPEKLQALISDSKLDELVNSALKAMEEAKAKDPKGFAERQEKLKEEMKASAKQWKESKRWEYRIPTDIKTRIEYRTPRTGEWEGYNHWYPMSEGYCRLLDFPANVADDFLLGIIETASLVIANPPTPRPQFPHDPDGKHAEKTCARTVEIAKKALQKATDLRSERAFQAVTIPGQRVEIIRSVPWTDRDEAVAPRPKVGLKGKVANSAEYPFPTPPQGKTAVFFKAKDFGYEPYDKDHETLCLYIPTDCLGIRKRTAKAGKGI